MFIPDQRVAEVISRLTGVPAHEIRVSSDAIEFPSSSFDSLDTVELILELEEEFDKETVRWARRHIAALSARAPRNGQATPQAAHSGTAIWTGDRQLSIAGSRPELGALPHDPAINHVQAGDNPNPDPERLASGRGVFFR